VEHFVTLERAIACPQATVHSAAETAAHVLGQAGYRRGLGFGPTASYVRSYRPTWAVIVAILGALPTVGLSLLLFLYRTKDHCNVVIEDGQYGVVALVSGRIPVSLPTHLEASVGQQPQPGQQSAAGHPSQMPPPMVLSPSGSHRHEPAFSPQAILRPATPVPPMPVADSPFPPAGSPFPPAGSPYPAPNAAPGAVPAAPAAANGYQAPAPPSWAETPQPPPPAPPSWVEVPASQDRAESSPRHPRAGAPPSEQQPDRHAEPIERREPADQPAAPEQARPEQESVAAPVAFRPPSKLGPQLPADPNLPVGSGAGSSAANGFGVNGGAPNGANAPAEDDDPFASSSGRVPWAVSGIRPPGPPPSPPFPMPASTSAAPSGSASSAAPATVIGSVATALGRQAPVLRVDSGETLATGAYCLLGREPATRDGDPAATLVKLDDPKLSVSKTHLAYGVDERGLWVMDRNSTNGTTVIDPSGQRIPCAAGARHYVPVGAQVQIGQRRLTVETTDGAAGNE
jgi:hypothetical protein